MWHFSSCFDAYIWNSHLCLLSKKHDDSTHFCFIKDIRVHRNLELFLFAQEFQKWRFVHSIKNNLFRLFPIIYHILATISDIFDLWDLTWPVSLRNFKKKCCSILVYQKWHTCHHVITFQTRPRHSLISLGIKTLTLKKKRWCLSCSPFLHRTSSKKPLGFYSSLPRDYKRIFVQHFSLRGLLLVELRSPLKKCFWYYWEILIKSGILTKPEGEIETYACIYTQMFICFCLIDIILYTLCVKETFCEKAELQKFWIPNINYCNYAVYFVTVLISTTRVNNNYRKKIKY